MVRYYEIDDLPSKFRAMIRIMDQPFFGRLPENAVRPMYIRSHLYWVVGTLTEVMDAALECHREEDRLFTHHGLKPWDVYGSTL